MMPVHTEIHRNHMEVGHKEAMERKQGQCILHTKSSEGVRSLYNMEEDKGEYYL